MTQRRAVMLIAALPLAFAACDHLNTLVPDPKDYAAAVREDSPLIYWRFEEGSGTRAVDSSGNAHDGQYLASPTFNATVGARTGAAIRVANTYGTWMNQDAGVVSDNGSWTELHALTLEAWIRPEKISTTEGQFIIDKGDTWSLLIDASGHPRLQFPWDPGRALYGLPLQTGQTYHLVGTYQPGPSGSTQRGVMKLYVNGELVGEDDNAASAIPIPSSATPIHAATGLSSGRWGYTGVVDEVAIYDHALTAAAILRHYSLGK